MDKTTIMSILALVIAFISIPVSYFTAVRQVKIGLDERERRSVQNAQILVANKIDEFEKIFCAFVYENTGITSKEIQSRSKEINPHLPQIDQSMFQVNIMDELVLAINQFAAIGYGNFSHDSDVVGALQSIKANIALGSDENRYVTAVIIKFCHGSGIQSKLRKI